MLGYRSILEAILYYWGESVTRPFEMSVQFSDFSCPLCVGTPFAGIPCSLSWPCCLRSVNSPRWAPIASPRQALTWTLRILSVIRRRRANPSSVRTPNSTTWWDTSVGDFFFFFYVFYFFSLIHFGEGGCFPCSTHKSPQVLKLFQQWTAYLEKHVLAHSNVNNDFGAGFTTVWV